MGILFVLFWSDTASADDNICVPRIELENAAQQLDNLKRVSSDCIQESHKIKSQRDVCLGRLEQLEILLRAKEIELNQTKTHNSVLKAELDGKWPAWVWFSIGAASAIGGVFVFQIAK